MQSVIGALRVNLGIDTAAFSDGLKKANSKLAGFGKQMAKVGAGISVASGALALGIKEQLSAADEMTKTAAKIGIPVDELSRLAHAADLSGVSMGGLETAVGRLSRNMADAKDGTAEAVDAFARVGVSATDAQGNLRPASDVMAEISDKFAAMPDGAAKTAAAMELMGRSGADMIPLLNGGADALQSLMSEADSLGIVITPEMGAAAEAFNDNMRRLQLTFTGLGAQITASLAPTLAMLSEKVIAVAKWFQDLSPRTQKIISLIAGLTVVLGPVVTALGLLAIAVAAIGAPVAIVIAAVAGLTAAVVAFSPEIMAAKDAVVAFGVEALDWIKEKFAGIAEFFKGLPAEFAQIGRDIISGLWDGMREKWEALKSKVTGIATGIADSVRGVLGIQSPSKVFHGIGVNIMEGLTLGIESEAGSAVDAVEGYANQISSTFADVLTGATSFREGLGNILGDIGGGLLDKGIGGLFGGFGVPGFANGTRSAPGGLALVGERGAEIVNLPRGASVAPNRMLPDFGHSGGRVDVVVRMDGNGNLTPFVERVSGRVSATAMNQVRAEVPGLVAESRERTG